jgi:hypothetical protein
LLSLLAALVAGQITTVVRDQPRVVNAMYVSRCCSIAEAQEDVKKVDWKKLMHCVNE